MDKAKESNAFVEVGGKLFTEDSSSREDSSAFSFREKASAEVASGSNNKSTSPLDSVLCKTEYHKSLLDRIRLFGSVIYKRLKVERLSTESIEAALFSLDHKVDLINEVNTDAPPEGIKQLTLLMCIKDFDINLVFTEDGSFIDYKKVQAFYRQYYEKSSFYKY